MSRSLDCKPQQGRPRSLPAVLSSRPAFNPARLPPRHGVARGKDPGDLYVAEQSGQLCLHFT